MNDESGMSCLMTAGSTKQFEMVKKLIESGAEINQINFKNKNALYYASYHMNSNDNIILFLLESGAFICDRSRKLLSRSTNQEILKYLE
jgi:ankyrin repeat protein